MPLFEYILPLKVIYEAVCSVEQFDKYRSTFIDLFVAMAFNSVIFILLFFIF